MCRRLTADHEPDIQCQRHGGVEHQVGVGFGMILVAASRFTASMTKRRPGGLLLASSKSAAPSGVLVDAGSIKPPPDPGSDEPTLPYQSRRPGTAERPARYRP